MTPVRQSAKAMLQSSMLLGLCKAGVLTTATIATRLLRKAKTQSGTFTATRTASFMKAAVSLTGTNSSAGKLQMPSFTSEAIFESHSLMSAPEMDCFIFILNLQKRKKLML